MALTRVPRGLIAASAISVAAHAALVVAPWWRSMAGGDSRSTPTIISTRVIDVEPPLDPATTQADLPPALVSPNSAVPVETAPAPTVVDPPRVAPVEAVGSPPEEIKSTPAASIPDPSAAAVPAAPTTIPTAPATNESEPSSGLDRGPKPLDDIEPTLPPAAGARGGSVTLHLVISDRGVVESVEVVRSSPPGLFDASAVAAFAHVRFSPGLKAGIPVRSEVTYEVTVAPIGRGSSASGRTY